MIPGPRPPLLVITGARDRLVSKDSARPNRPHDFIEVPDVGYLGVIFEQQTADAILAWADANASERARRNGGTARRLRGASSGGDGRARAIFNGPVNSQVGDHGALVITLGSTNVGAAPCGMPDRSENERETCTC